MKPFQARLLVLTAVWAQSAIAGAVEPSAIVFDRNVPQDLRNQVLNDITFVGSLEGSAESVLHNEIFGSVGGTTYKRFFEAHVKKAGVQDCGSPNAVACVQPSWFGTTDKIWFTNNYTRFSHPSIARLMIIFHEARHTEDDHGNWSHATCPTPFRNERGEDMRSIWTGASLAGEPACDVTPKGSYGSSTIMLKNISQFCSNCTEKVKADAALYAADQIGRITNAQAKRQMIEDPVARREGNAAL